MNDTNDPHGWNELFRIFQGLINDFSAEGHIEAANRLAIARDCIFNRMPTEFMMECLSACNDVLQEESNLPKDLVDRVKETRKQILQGLNASGIY